MRKVALLFTSVVMLLVFALPAFAQDDAPGTIVDIVVAAASADPAEFSILLAAVQAADPSVLAALNDPMNSFTVFAPTDAAFTALFEMLGEEAVNELLANPEAVTEILLFHVVPFAVFSEEVGMVLGMAPEGMAIPLDTLNGQFIDVAVDADGNPTINGAGLVTVDIQASNGVIHVIDAVILPETRTIAGIVSDLAAADEPQFTTLLAAVGLAGLVEVLSDTEAEFTVFAPVDAAFAALDADTLNAALADMDLLTTVLTYHVVAGRLDVNSIADMLFVEEGAETPEWFAGLTEDGAGVLINTLQGGTITIVPGMMFSATANEANIVAFNIDASNGIIHVIDAVLLP